nr:hypothetical protein [Tanacetum cinerariifolium]
MQNQLTNLTDLITKFVNSNTASTSSSGTLPSNTITNPRSDLKAITTRCGMSYDGPQIPPSPSSFPRVVEDGPEATKDTVNPTNNKNTEDVQPQAVQSKSPVLIFKPVTSPISELTITSVSASKPNPKALIPYPSRRNDERNPLIGNKEKLSEMARTPLNEHRSAVLLKKLPEKLGDPDKFLIPCDFPADRSISRPVGVAEDVYVKVGSFHFRADFVVIDFDADPRVPLILRRSLLKIERALIDVFEEFNAFLAVEDEPTSYKFHQSYLDPEGDIFLLEAFLNDDPSLPTPDQRNYLPEVRKELKICEAYSKKYSVDESHMVEIKDLPPHLDYAFLEEFNAFLAVEDEPTSYKFHQSYLDPEGDIFLLEAFLNDDPSLPTPDQRNYLPEVRKELKICEAYSKKYSVDESHMVEIKDLPPHLDYPFLEGDDKLPVIIAKDLSVEEKIALLTWRTIVDCLWTTVDHHRSTVVGRRSTVVGRQSTLGPGLVWIESGSGLGRVRVGSATWMLAWIIYNEWESTLVSASMLPVLGTVYDSLDECIEIYRKYASEAGFAGSESRPPMLNKENYVPWSSRLLRYAKSRPNGKLIHNSIINGSYVRQMIPKPGDTNREVHVNET